MKKIGCIDIGTNSIRMLGLETDNKGNFIPIIRCMEIVRPGRGVGLNRELAVDSIKAVKDTLKQFKNSGKRLGIDTYYAVCTSAVRDADNREEFLKEITETFNIPVKLLSGEEEAVLTYIGAIYGEHLRDIKTIVIDIGGGSTEIILGKGYDIIYFKSINIGAVRMTERFISSDPIIIEEYKEMLNSIRQDISACISDIKGRETDIELLIGVGGTITTLAAMLLDMKSYDPEKISGFSFGLNQLKIIIDDLLSKDIEERKKIPGLQPKRADIIPVGAGILLVLMEELGLKNIKVKDSDLLMGMALKIFQNDKMWI